MANVWFEGLKQIMMPSGDKIQKDFRQAQADTTKSSDAEKGDSSPIPPAQTSAAPIYPAPTPPAQPPAISAKEPEPALASKPEPAKETKASRGKKPPAETLTGQPAEFKGYTIQVNAFRDLKLAEEFIETQKKRGYHVYINKIQVKDQDAWYRVCLGRFANRAEAVRHVKEKKVKDHFPKCFIQRLP